MSYIKFDKTQLVNLEYSLNRELLRSNRAGSYACTTIIGCNTRKYHGLLIAPQPAIDGDNHVLLTAFDETIIQHGTEFNLGIHKFKGEVYMPKGHKYVTDFEADPIPVLTYRVGGVVLQKERLFLSNDARILFRYTLVDAHSPTLLRLRPFMSFRNHHHLSKANHFVEKKYQLIENGIKVRMYQGYSHLHMQFSKPPEYTHVPDWYYNFEYIREKERGYDCLEDLYTPGYFEISIKKGESIIFSAGLSPITVTTLKRAFSDEVKKRIPRDSFENCLGNAAQQFIVRRGKRTDIIAGFPWFGRWGRDTFISLPGLTLVLENPQTFIAVINTILQDLHGSLFPNFGTGQELSYNSVDAPLWFFWALQQYVMHTNRKQQVWKEYGHKMKTILEGYRNGDLFNLKMLDNGLIYAGETGKALTWMDAIVDGKPVTPRAGMPVEVNSLWYNAIMFSLELSRIMDDTSFIEGWQDISSMIPLSFIDTFWDDKKGYLADYVDGDYKNFDVRPNMVFATSLPYTPLDEEKRKSILDVIRNELLTSRGLRTLSPSHPDYQGVYYGDQSTRDRIYHNGCVFPWLLGHFVEGYLRIHGKSGLRFVKLLYSGFEEVIQDYGIGTIAELYDGDPPHKAGGAISQAWSVAELLRIGKMLKKYET
ncbi:MAG: glycogen debranching enzyme N-terminal domain-containing protein [Bacteroidetes bacterium]|nr:glycogen debranching enzyme N-terminal domain-containing protein [Bacteroidota bacterium]